MFEASTQDYASKTDDSKPQKNEGDAAGATAGVIDDVADKAKEWAHAATDNVKEAAGATADMAEQIKDKTKDAIHSTGEAIHSGSEQLNRTIRKYPLQSLLCAMALGYLLGRVTSRS